MMTLSHINISSEESLNGGGQVGLSGTVPHQEPFTDGLSPLISPHRDFERATCFIPWSREGIGHPEPRPEQAAAELQGSEGTLKTEYSAGESD